MAHLEQAYASQGKKVDAREVERLENQIEGLKQDNLALSQALEAYSEADYDTQFEELNEKISDLQAENQGLGAEKQSLEERNTVLQTMNTDFSARLEKLIGNVQQVLEEEEDG